MNQSAHITISGNTYPFREKLKQAGLSWDGKAWTGTFSLKRIEKFKQFCCHYDLQYIIEGDNFKESRLPRGLPPVPNASVPAFMGEGKLQWEIEEMIELEKKRRQQLRKKTIRNPKFKI